MRSWTGPVGAGRVANGAGIQALRVELLDLNGNWAPEKNLEAAGSLVKGEA